VALTRLLLVEDNPVDAFVFRGFVEAMPGWQVVHAARLADARALVHRPETEPFDAVVVDLSLPDARGLEAVHFARDRMPSTVCVVVTGEAQLDTAVQALKDGASDYLVKGDLQPRGVQRALQFALLRRDLVRRTEESERNLRGVLSAMHDALYVVDESGAVRFANAAAGRLASPFEGDGGGPIELWPHRGADVVEQTVVRTAEGEEITVEARSRRVSWAGEEATLVVLRDLSAERAAQDLRGRAQAAERMAAVGDAAMKDWHDVRKKLLYMSEALADLQGDPVCQAAHPEPLSVLQDAQKAILAIADRYRKQAVTLRNVRLPIDVTTLVRTTCSSYRARIEPTARLHLRLRPVPLVLGDDVELGVAIENLLANAVEAIADGGVSEGVVRVSTRAMEDHVAIMVSDNGPGFPAGPLERWFRERETSRAGGTGLGLPRVREVARRHGGDVSVNSTVGGGASITLRLPIAKTEPERAGRRVLVIEDDPIAVRATRRMLAQHYRVVVAGDGQEALDLLAEDDAFDAILCDLEMPRVDGRVFYQRLVADRPDLASRVAFCSGGASTPEMLTFLKTAGPRMLPKPYSPEAAIALIEALVAEHAQGS
jgi:signal transduction histidine kinase